MRNDTAMSGRISSTLGVMRMTGRTALLAAFCLALGACNGALNTISSEVPGSASDVRRELAGLHGGMGPGLLGLPPIERVEPGDGRIGYVLPSMEGAGTGIVTLRVVADGDDTSTVDLRVDLPEIANDIDKSKQVLAQAKATRLLRRAIESWADARARRQPSRKALAAMDDRLGYLLLSMSPRAASKAARDARDNAALEPFAQGYLEWSGDPAADQPDRAQLAKADTAGQSAGSRNGGWAEPLPDTQGSGDWGVAASGPPPPRPRRGSGKLGNPASSTGGWGSEGPPPT